MKRIVWTILACLCLSASANAIEYRFKGEVTDITIGQGTSLDIVKGTPFTGTLQLTFVSLQATSFSSPYGSFDVMTSYDILFGDKVIAGDIFGDVTWFNMSTDSIWIFDTGDPGKLGGISPVEFDFRFDAFNHIFNPMSAVDIPILDDSLFSAITLFMNSDPSSNGDFTLTGKINTFTPVPEPSTLLLFAIGTIGVAAIKRKPPGKGRRDSPPL